MQGIHGERRIGVRRTRRKGMLLVLLLGIVGVTYLWQVSRHNSEAVHLEKISSEAGNLRLVVESSDKNKSKHGGLLNNDITMATNQSSIKEDVHLIKVAQLTSRNENDTLFSPSPKVSQVKLSLQEKASSKSAGELENHLNVGSKEKLNRDITNENNSSLNRDVLSDRLPLRSEEGVQEGEKKQVSERREEESQRTQQLKKEQVSKNIPRLKNRFNGHVPGMNILKQPVPYVQTENRAQLQETSKNNNLDTVYLKTGNKESVTLSMIAEDYKQNYTQPRYSFSSEGQFQLVNFVKELENLSRDDTFENSPFNARDKIRLILLSKGKIREIYSIAHHLRLRMVAFDTPKLLPYVVPIESCPACGTIKSPEDINEVFAFHVDRVLGINRALPVTAREFQDIELENLDLEEDLKDYDDKSVPFMWFAKDLTHGGKFQTDQNSFQLNWRQYQEILSECHKTTNLTRAINCTEIEYSEWSRMAVFDFIMQNHDRLDRYCCGYDGVDEGENCFHSEVMDEIEGCDDTEHRYLVHILTAESNPQQLVLLDNAGNLHRSKDHLNYEILKGINTIPKAVMETIYSENLEDRLLESVKWDSVYWRSFGEENIKRQVHTILERVDMLKAYIRTSGIAAI